MNETQEYIARLKRERDRADQRRKHEAEMAALRAQRQADRRADEQLQKRLIELRYGVKSLTGQISGQPLPLDVVERVHRLRLAQAGIVLDKDKRWIHTWEEHVRTQARMLNVIVNYVAAIAGVNAYALMGQRAIEVSPITSEEIYAAALHELGHHARPCDQTHARVTVDVRKGVCVPCEIAAWGWAILQAKPTWTQRMHNEMARSLPTYREYGTPAEQREIDRLTSTMGFRESLVARWRSE